ncbi:hypothetical protein PU088_000246 [Citrobacter farmeri]|uniref:hypothetical protein n=1 Tax=Citrobacter amalonaticus TaxID=35703 RepID=UPI0012D3A099|nr:hypothetical protein [Citrobacter amalonaticus]EKV5652840.1 hypothetical protein [Citrobacter farmeri]
MKVTSMMKNLARRIPPVKKETKKREHCKNSAPGSFRSIPATFRAPCSSVTTFPVVLRPVVHPEHLHPAPHHPDVITSS